MNVFPGKLLGYFYVCFFSNENMYDDSYFSHSFLSDSDKKKPMMPGYLSTNEEHNNKKWVNYKNKQSNKKLEHKTVLVDR